MLETTKVINYIIFKSELKTCSLQESNLAPRDKSNVPKITLTPDPATQNLGMLVLILFRVNYQKIQCTLPVFAIWVMYNFLNIRNIVLY